jgi:hypothetical protein
VIHSGKLAVLGLLGVFSLAASGCQQEEPRIEAPSFNAIYAITHAPRPLGPMGVKLKALLEHARAENCERVQADMRRELVDRLDERAAQIQAMAEVVEPGSGFDRVKWGPTTVLRMKDAVDPHAGWVESPSSWQNAFEYYRQIKDQPSNPWWVWLDGNVRSLMFNDASRIVSTVNFYLDKDSGPMIDALDRAMSACLGDSNCASPAFNRAQIEFIQKIPYYSAYWTLFQRAVSVEEKRTQLQGLARWFASDVQRFRLRVNSTISRPSPRELKLPLVAGAFAGYEAHFSDFVESVWSSKALQLKIDWVDATVVPLAFKVLLDDTFGERPYVSFTERKLQLFPGSRLRSIAHEVGHVLGFLDHYYTVWHPETCSYIQQSNAGDIMSFEGVVTPGEWRELNQAYPVQPAAVPIP